MELRLFLTINGRHLTQSPFSHLCGSNRRHDNGIRFMAMGSDHLGRCAGVG
jgi:hypothetical protein